MVLDAFEQAIHSCGMPENVIHLSDRGLHYLPIRCTNRLDAATTRHQLVQRVTDTTIHWLSQ